MWRTPVEAARAAGWWPFVYGGYYILIGPPFLAVILLVVGSIVPKMFGEPIMFFGFIFIWSPLFTAPALIGTVPLAILASRLGWAGWGAALIGGGLSGAIVAYLMRGPTLMFLLMGIIFGGLYWLIIWLRWPEAFGIVAVPAN